MQNAAVSMRFTLEMKYMYVHLINYRNLLLPVPQTLSNRFWSIVTSQRQEAEEKFNTHTKPYVPSGNGYLLKLLTREY